MSANSNCDQVPLFISLSLSLSLSLSVTTENILSIVSKANRRISKMVRKFISREVNVLKKYKTLLEYCSQLSKYGN